MAKTFANWSQTSKDDNTVKRERPIFLTNKNTPLEQWKKLASEELSKVGLNESDLNQYTMLHSWEGGFTPDQFAKSLLYRLNRTLERNGGTPTNR